MTINEWQEYNEGKPINEWARIPKDIEMVHYKENGIVLIDEKTYSELKPSKDEYTEALLKRVEQLESDIEGYKTWVDDLKEVIAYRHRPVEKQAKKVERVALKLITELNMLKVISND